MEPVEQREKARFIVILFVVTLTGLITWGVIHKLNKSVIEPTKPYVVDIMAVPTTQGK